jgi:hypothetical protein
MSDLGSISILGTALNPLSKRFDSVIENLKDRRRLLDRHITHVDRLKVEQERDAAETERDVADAERIAQSLEREAAARERTKQEAERKEWEMTRAALAQSRLDENFGEPHPLSRRSLPSISRYKQTIS